MVGVGARAVLLEADQRIGCHAGEQIVPEVLIAAVQSGATRNAS